MEDLGVVKMGGRFKTKQNSHTEHTDYGITLNQTKSTFLEDEKIIKWGRGNTHHGLIFKETALL